jgi:hypothetical protein
MQLLLLINDNYDKYTEKHKKKLSLPIWIKSVFMELVEPKESCNYSAIHPLKIKIIGIKIIVPKKAENRLRLMVHNS